MSKNSEDFKRYCEIACDFINRDDRDDSPIKSVIRYVVREASNRCSDLPGYDNKLGAEIVSKLAYEQITAGNMSDLVGEHVVPVSIINKKLLELSKINVEEISKTIKKFSIRAVITKKEDKRLRDMKLFKTMPVDWDEKDIMARYESAKIEIKKIGYKECINKNASK